MLTWCTHFQVLKPSSIQLKSLRLEVFTEIISLVTQAPCWFFVPGHELLEVIAARLKCLPYLFTLLGAILGEGLGPPGVIFWAGLLPNFLVWIAWLVRKLQRNDILHLVRIAEIILLHAHCVRHVQLRHFVITNSFFSLLRVIWALQIRSKVGELLLHGQQFLFDPTHLENGRFSCIQRHRLVADLLIGPLLCQLQRLTYIIATEYLKPILNLHPLILHHTMWWPWYFALPAMWLLNFH